MWVRYDRTLTASGKTRRWAELHSPFDFAYQLVQIILKFQTRCILSLQTETWSRTGRRRAVIIVAVEAQTAGGGAYTGLPFWEHYTDIDALNQRSSRSARRQDLSEGPLASPRYVSAAIRFCGPVRCCRWSFCAVWWTWVGWMLLVCGG